MQQGCTHKGNVIKVGEEISERCPPDVYFCRGKPPYGLHLKHSQDFINKIIKQSARMRQPIQIIKAKQLDLWSLEAQEPRKRSLDPQHLTPRTKNQELTTHLIAAMAPPPPSPLISLSWIVFSPPLFARARMARRFLACTLVTNPIPHLGGLVVCLVPLSEQLALVPSSPFSIYFEFLFLQRGFCPYS